MKNKEYIEEEKWGRWKKSSVTEGEAVQQGHEKKIIEEKKNFFAKVTEPIVLISIFHYEKEPQL